MKAYDLILDRFYMHKYIEFVIIYIKSLSN